ncbi:FecR domain-containing protein [Pseudomonas schmalbachii]|uniref:FecR domain-containing protein n=1 Tax=Pseudomonas schmalbachii TaxID=2816993 RepID=A0ABS3TQG8_9PSED|nr:FecR domain-containing protein [Pseudomonas schmalbachii]MBO3275922.1 FecR domain-containing protein [Pseudomonas schmalbachii]
MNAKHEMPVPPAVVEQASEWLMLHWSGEMDAVQRKAFHAWHAADPEHRRVWQRLQHLQGTLAGVPAATARAVLSEQPDQRRRQFLKLTGWMLAVGASGYLSTELPWRETFADQRTAKGDRRHLRLDDGSLLDLNSGTAVDIRFGALERRIRLLSGEILLRSGQDPVRPLIVETAAGDIQALGTRFAVRELDGGSRVDLYQGEVEIRPRHVSGTRLKAGQRLWFDADRLGLLQTADANACAWSEGRLVAERQPLGQFLAELARHRPGLLRCSDDAAELLLTGVFPLADTDRILAALERSLPVRVSYRTRYWVTVEHRA